MLPFAQQTASRLEPLLELVERHGEDLFLLWFFFTVTFLLMVPPVAYLIKKHQERQHRHEERLAMIQAGRNPEDIAKSPAH